MSQIKPYIFLFFLYFLVNIEAVSQSQSDEESPKEILQKNLDLAELLIERGDYEYAKSKFEKALDIAIALDKKKSQGVIYNKIAKLQYLLNRPDEAILSLSKAVKIQTKTEDYTNLGLTYNIRGVIHSNLKQYDTALKYFSNALQKFQHRKSKKYQAEVNLNEAIVYLKLNQNNKAREKLEHAIIVAKKHDLNQTLSNCYLKNADIYFKDMAYNLALDQALSGLEIAKEIKSVAHINDANLILSKIYQSKKQYRSANNYLSEHIRLKDSIYNSEKEKFAATGVYKKTTPDDKQLLEQLAENQTGNLLEKLSTTLSISLVTILSLLSLALYKNNRIRLSTNTMLQEKNDELVVAKDKAELASKTKANFLSTVTHELRTPLYAVTGLTSLLLDEEPKEKQIPHLKSLKFSGEYLLTFINDILQINKIEANKVELDPEEFNLKLKVKNVIAALSNSAKDNNTKIHLEYEDKLPETYMGDQLKISQILINLLGNAIKFTKDGDIWVKVHKKSSRKDLFQLHFEIRDNGIGISKDKQEQMFDSFSQGSIQINRKYGGTGLGLSIVKGLIKILNGKIYLKSQLGEGTSFFFEIPLKQIEPRQKEDIKKDNKRIKNIKSLDLENIKILVVEDNKINQMITKKILNKIGLECDIIDNGEDAVKMVRNTKYNIVLMDIHMPGISGLEATKRIRKFDKELTIFALTAVTIDDKMQEFDNAGFNDIISKPFKRDVFEEKLYTVLSKKTETANS